MTTHAKQASMEIVLRSRSHHNVLDTEDAKAALKRAGKAARKMRLALDMSQDDLAQKVRVSTAQISNFELGRNWLAMPVYRRLCAVLGAGLPPLMK